MVRKVKTLVRLQLRRQRTVDNIELVRAGTALYGTIKRSAAQNYTDKLSPVPTKEQFRFIQVTATQMSNPNGWLMRLNGKQSIRNQTGRKSNIGSILNVFKAQCKKKTSTYFSNQLL